jgi:nucleoid-associated protein Lsr2
VRFGLDGTEYEIDLNKKNAAALRKNLAPFVEHARKAGRGARAGNGAATSGHGRKARASRSAAADASRERGGAIRSRYPGTVTTARITIGES